eukprot:194470-Amphidinium_carterae.2
MQGTVEEHKLAIAKAQGKWKRPEFANSLTNGHPESALGFALFWCFVNQATGKTELQQKRCVCNMSCECKLVQVARI